MDSAPRYEVSLNTALAAIAQVGDLSMGQPLGHSLRVARLAGQLAQARRADPGQVKVVEQVALLRCWSAP